MTPQPPSPTHARSTTPFWLLSSLTLVATAGLISAVTPALTRTAHQQATHLAETAHHTTGLEQQLAFELAKLLQPGNPDLALNLAEVQLQNGQPVAALKTLSKSNRQPATSRLKLKAYLETGNPTGALTAAAALADQTTRNEDLLLAIMGRLASGETDITPLKARLTSPEAAQRADRAAADKTALAVELYVLGLPDSAQQLLEHQPASLPRSIILGQLALRRQTTTGNEAAKQHFLTAAQLDPGNVEAHQGLQQAYSRLGDTDASARQQKLVSQLKTGRP